MAFKLVEEPNLDPTEEVLPRRTSLIRRMLAKHPDLQPVRDRIVGDYARAGAHGTNADPMYLVGLSPAPPPGFAPDEPWKPTVDPPAGPIGPLLQLLHDNCMDVDAEWIIVDANQLQLNFRTCPAQMLKPLKHLACTHVRTQYFASAQTDMADIRRCDPWVMCRVTKAMPPELHARLFLIHTLGSFSEKKPSLFSTLANPAGPHCGHPHGTPLHKFWHCPAHAAARFEGAEHLKSLSIGRGLHHMTLGIHSTYDAMPNEHVACPIF